MAWREIASAMKHYFKMISYISWDFLLDFLNRILNDAVYNFPNNQEEVTLVVCPETFKVKNYVDDEPGEKEMECSLKQRKQLREQSITCHSLMSQTTRW